MSISCLTLLFARPLHIFTYIQLTIQTSSISQTKHKSEFNIEMSCNKRKVKILKIHKDTGFTRHNLGPNIKNCLSPIKLKFLLYKNMTFPWNKARLKSHKDTLVRLKFCSSLTYRIFIRINIQTTIQLSRNFFNNIFSLKTWTSRVQKKRSKENKECNYKLVSNN